MNRRRQRAIVLALVVIGACGLGTAGSAEPIALSADLEVTRISERIWHVVSYTELETWGRVGGNGLVVVDGGEAALLDTPWNDEQTELLIDWIESDLEARVTIVVPTHYHADCMGGLRAAHARGAASHALDKTVAMALERDLPAPGHPFSERAELEVGELRLVLAHHGGAHTADNIVVWIPAEQVLFGGCAVRSAGARGLGNVREAVFDEWPNTIESIRAAYPDAQWILPGHGRPGGMELLDRTAELLRSAAEKERQTADGSSPAPR